MEKNTRPREAAFPTLKAQLVALLVGAGVVLTYFAFLWLNISSPPQ